MGFIVWIGLEAKFFNRFYFVLCAFETIETAVFSLLRRSIMFIANDQKTNLRSVRSAMSPTTTLHSYGARSITY